MLSQTMNPNDFLGPSGFYIEAGANDGVSQSSTLMLEKRGWHGLLIEPNKTKLNECKASRSNKNIFEHCALVSSEYNNDTICGNFTESEIDASLTGQVIIPSRHWDIPHKIAAEEKTIRKIIDVPAKTLQSLVDKHKINTIDYLVLDIEGYEYEAMEGLDFSKNQPKFIRVETSSLQYRIDAMIEYLLTKDYRFLGMANINDCFFSRFC